MRVRGLAAREKIEMQTNEHAHYHGKRQKSRYWHDGGFAGSATGNSWPWDRDPWKSRTVLAQTRARRGRILSPKTYRSIDVRLPLAQKNFALITGESSAKVSANRGWRRERERVEREVPPSAIYSACLYRKEATDMSTLFIGQGQCGCTLESFVSLSSVMILNEIVQERGESTRSNTLRQIWFRKVTTNMHSVENSLQFDKYVN